VDPYNRARAAAGQDYTDRLPVAQYRRDVRAEIAALREAMTTLAAIRWPARVAPYVHALRTTDMIADLGCERDLAKARSYGQADTISFNQVCTQAQNTNNADTIRSLLHLPPQS
jgi:hypothetical protein